MILLAIAAAAQWNLSDIIADDTRALQRKYEQCVSVAARRFSRSKDQADVVASAAMTKCKPEKRTYLAALNGDSIETDGKPFSFKFLSKMEKALDEKVRNNALLVITEVRSAR